MHANKHVSEAKPAEDVDTPMTFTMEGFQGEPPSSLIPFFWSPGWNSYQAINKYQIEVGGPLHGGDPGIRLLEPSASAHAYFSDIPDTFKAGREELRFIPVYHIFGSEEFSSASPAVAERIPAAYIALSKPDAERLKLNNGDETEISVDDHKIKVKVMIKPELKEGLAGLPAGFKGMTPAVNVKLSDK